MSNEELFRELATRACCEALQDVLQEKSRELAEGVAQKMGAALTTRSSDSPERPRSERSRLLRDGALLISNSRTQTETLEALLAAGASLVSGCGLMILRGAQASGWNSVGLASPETFRGATMDTTAGAAAAVLSSCAARVARASEVDQAFAAQMGLESSVELLLVPVMLKERVAALLLAFSGDSEDLAALEILVQVTQLALELQGYRKSASPPAQTAAQSSAQPAKQAAPSAMEAAQRAPAAPVSASSATMYGTPETSRTEAVQPPAYSAASAVSSAVAPQSDEGGQFAGPPAESSSFGQPSPVLDEAHERGRRFAKLLVEEIKLYNQAKVSEGRAQRDLYSRLREDIEKSRAAYQKRYGETVKDVDYFSQELMRILADNDRSLMGAGFPG